MENGSSPGSDSGFTTIQFVFAVAISLFVFVMAANLVVFQYARGTVRAAVDEGVRTASRETASAADCERRSAEVLDAILGGSMRGDVTVSCRTLDDGTVTASASARLTSWLPIVPDWNFEIAGTAHKESAP